MSESKIIQNNNLTLSITKKEKRVIREIIDSVKNTELFRIAFTHRSCRNNNNNQFKSYETLEFFGDSLLGYYVAKFIYLVYKNYNEGDMTKLKSLMVESKNLAKLSKEIGLNQHLILNLNLDKATNENLSNNTKTLSDIFESFIAALYLEKGEDIFIQFLLLTIFNNSNTKDKIEEYNKIHKVRLASLSELTSSSNNNNLENRDIVISMNKQSMSQITFKFEKAELAGAKAEENKIEALLDNNNQIIIKELIKLHATYDQIISSLNIRDSKNNHIIEANKNNVLNELKNIDLNQQNIFKEIKIINKCIEKFDINKLELDNFINKIEERAVPYFL